MTQRRLDSIIANSPFTRGKKVAFQFEGKTMEGFKGEPLAMSLLASGVRVFGRSIKYHRPRGPICLHGHCNGCIMRVDGVPNQRTCEIPCASGIEVERQIGWPGTGHDVFRVMDWIYGDRMDHHSLFTSSGTMNRMAMGIVRKMSGFGHPPTADPPAINPIETIEAQSVVIGAGVAGIHAAMVLASEGHKVILLEQSDKIGGEMLDRSCSIKTDGHEAMSGWDARQDVRKQFSKIDDIELHQKMPVVAVYGHQDHLQVIATNDCETMDIRTNALVLANGAWDQVPLFQNNDLPGIFSIRALDRLVFGWGVVPGEPIALCGNADSTIRLALELHKEKVAIAAMITQREPDEEIEQLQSAGINVINGYKLHKARGRKYVSAIELVSDDEQNLVVDCGALAAEAPMAPAYELAHHAFCRVEFHSETGYTIVSDKCGRTNDKRIFAAGRCAGATDPDHAREQGKRAGMACALSLRPDKILEDKLGQLCEGR